MALRRILALALVLAGLGAGVVAGASGAPRGPSTGPVICPLAGDAAAPTVPCCGPPRATAPATRRGPETADAACPPCEGRPCPQPVPTVPQPTPLPTPQLTIPAGGLTVRHGRFKVTCTLAGASGGPCAVSARRSGQAIGQGSKALRNGRARVTVRLVVGGRAMLSQTRHHRMRARLIATAGGRTSTVTATLHGG